LTIGKGKDIFDMQDNASTFSYGEVEEILARVFRSTAEERPKLRARLRHLRNIGVPDLPRPGSGVKLSYTERQAFEMLIALGLELVGQTPRRAAQLSKDIIVKWYAYELEKETPSGIVIVSPESEPMEIKERFPETVGPALLTQAWFMMGETSLPFEDSDIPMIYSLINVGVCWRRLKEEIATL
jgi:hypothetical protein